MLMSLLLLVSHSHVAVPGALLATHQDPPVHVWLNADGDFTYLDRAKVYAKSAEDGYLVVLRSDIRTAGVAVGGDTIHGGGTGRSSAAGSGMGLRVTSGWVPG